MEQNEGCDENTTNYKNSPLELSQSTDNEKVNEGELGQKRQLNIDDENQIKVVKLDEQQFRNKLKRQLEYYLSDTNLRFDKFFHNIISATTDGWLDYKYMLGCKRIIELGASIDDIKSVLENSDVVECSDLGIRRKNNAALPELKERSNKKQNNFIDLNKLHDAGVFGKISNVSKDITYEVIKSELQKVLSNVSSTIVKKNRKYTNSSLVLFASNPDDEGTSYAYFASFLNDVKILSSINKIKLGNKELKFEIINNLADAKKAIKSLPRLIANKRLGILKKNENFREDITKTVNTDNAISIGGNSFVNIEHLVNCLREVLYCGELGKTVNSKSQKVISELLTYMPEGVELNNKMTSIIIGGTLNERKFVGIDANNNKFDIPVLSSIKAYAGSIDKNN